jgi:membrane protease YdiL (CAAX protease family)
MSLFLQNIITGFEYALEFGGLVYIGWLLFSSAGKAFRARPARLSSWDVSLSDVLFLGWLIFTFGLLGQFAVQYAISPLLRPIPDGETLSTLVAGSMFHFAALGTWLGSRAWARRHRPTAITPHAPATPAEMKLSLRGGLFTFLAVLPLATGSALVWERVLQMFGLPTAHQELVDMFLQSKSPASLGFLMTLAIVVAPVAEELVFRAGIFRYLRSCAPRWVAYCVSAGLFALMHANWMSALPLFILGLVFAASYEKTGRMTVPMIAHALFNFNTLLLVLSGVGK